MDLHTISNTLWEFIKKYYINSMVYKTGYNPVNSATWVILLALSCVAVYKTLVKYRVRFDEYFVAGNIPYIVFGSSIRVVEDAGFIAPPVCYLFMSPFIYMVVFAIAFPTFLLALHFRRENYWVHYGAFGAILAVATLLFLFTHLRVVNWWVLPAALAMAAAFLLIYCAVTSKFCRRMFNKLSCAVFFSQMLDGSATFLGISFLGYWEMHVIPRLLISIFGPWIMLPLKIVVFSAVLYLLDSVEESKDLVNFVKFVLIVLGLAPGLRDALRMTFQV